MTTIRSEFDIPYAQYAGAAGPVDLLLDLHIPENGRWPLPVIVWLPGGGWRSAARASGPVDFAARGFALACVTYRTSQVAIAPANIQDCKAAVRWVRGHAGEYGLDAERIGIWGGSAGGHLAALAALTAGVAELEGEHGVQGVSSAVRAACGACGPSDLMRMARPEFVAQFPVLHEVTAQYLGGPVKLREPLARLVSPLSHVKKEGAPLFLVHGRQDTVVPEIESIELYEALLAAGADVTLRLVEGAGHGIPSTTFHNQMAAFFERTLGPV